MVTKKGDLVLVHLTDTAGASEDEKAEQIKKPVAFFRVPRDPLGLCWHQVSGSASILTLIKSLP